MKKVLSIVAPELFQPIEYADSKKALEEAGIEVVLCSTHQIAFDKNDERYKVDVLLDEVFEDDYDAVLFVGGKGIQLHFDDPDFQSMARAFYDEGKVTAAICAAPVILAKAGLLDDKKATCWEGAKAQLAEAGAEVQDEAVVQDGILITGNGPDAATEFGQTVAQALQ
jgi:protease I